MNSLSSGYAASAHRSVSGIAGRVPDGENGESEHAPTPIAASKPNALRKNRIVAPPPSQYVSAPAPSDVGGDGGRGSESRGRMIYPYDANGDGEASVGEGREVVIVEPDDGSGWISVRCGAQEGLVPASYVEILPPQAATPTMPERPMSAYSNSSTSVAGSTTTTGGKRKGPAVAPKRGAKKLQYVEALYDYEARSDAEWSMAEGDRFVLVNRDGGDGWADVEKGGQTKSVPANYIHEVS